MSIKQLKTVKKISEVITDCKKVESSKAALYIKIMISNWNKFKRNEYFIIFLSQFELRHITCE